MPNHELEDCDICPVCKAGNLVIISDQNPHRECDECGAIESDDWDYCLTPLQEAFLEER